MRTIDINCDLGEGFGPYSLGESEEIFKYISSANIACGFHAGDPLVIQKTIEAALINNVSIGAHPGFSDLQGFGRREMKLSPDDLYSSILYQVSALKSMTEALGGHLSHVKIHGAMYNMAANNFEMARTIAKAVKQIDAHLIFYGLANSKMIEAAMELGLKTANEAFADRRYNKNGSLVTRSNSLAIIHDENECINQVSSMINKQKLTSIDGSTINMKADSICIHGDNKEALLFARKLNEELKANNIAIRPIKA